MSVAISRLFVAVAALAWILSMLVSLLSLVGVVAPDWFANGLLATMFPIALVSIVQLGRAAAGRILTFRLILGVAYERSPDWLKYASYGGLFYAIGLIATLLLGFALPETSLTMALFGCLIAGFSPGLWMTARSAKCANGHRVGPFEYNCRECGVTVAENLPT